MAAHPAPKPGRDITPTSGLPITYSLASEEAVTSGRFTRPDSRAQKASEVVAVEVVHDIVSQALQIGDRLPDEAAMLAQYGVSRETLREALRILEVQGFITIRRGPGGGPVIAGVDPAYLARTSALYYHLSGATYRDVFETWHAIEPGVAEKVALLTDRSLVRERLKPFVEPMPESVQRETFIATSNGFHSCLAQLTGNRVLVLVLQSINHIVFDHVMLDLDPIQARGTIEHDHRDIAQAILAGRSSKARRLSAEHIAHIRDTYETHWPERMRDLVEWR